ncbi:unnamed protein product [Triticum turgidum subsp. durum]|uniref:Malectin-like domain-containing protein n=1 Tax=Triticum turgidum subsp. durum TaxID=4567 RepID=A0A9R0X894_TRITD|nr:unnamed protein product [Triticum turgidum subsp. durum]
MGPLWVFFGAFVMAATAVHVAGQQEGFLSIDCGLDAKFSGRRDTYTDIAYVSDGPYVDGGENHRVAAELDTTDTNEDLRTLRSFPSGLRNCYTLPTKSGAKYLVRMLFFHGNYDGKTVDFDLHLGTNYWDTMSVGNTTDDRYSWSEAIFVAWASWVPVCLVNTGSGTPFVSTVELRPLSASLYPDVTIDESMSTYQRINTGGNFTRFPEDPYDRYWSSRTRLSWAKLSTKDTIEQDNVFAVPSLVLQTAVAPINNATVLYVNTWISYKTSLEFKFIFHFADIQNTQRRRFNIYMNNEDWYTNYSPPYLVADHVRSSKWYKTTGGEYNFTLAATNTSMMPPMINAYEGYTHIPHDTPRTFFKDCEITPLYL